MNIFYQILEHPDCSLNVYCRVTIKRNKRLLVVGYADVNCIVMHNFIQILLFEFKDPVKFYSQGLNLDVANH